MLGADGDTKLDIAFNGPTAVHIASPIGLRVSADNEVYARLSMTIAEFAAQDDTREAIHLDPLIEAYADDHVLVTTLRWLKERYG